MVLGTPWDQKKTKGGGTGNPVEKKPKMGACEKKKKTAMQPKTSKHKCPKREGALEGTV